MTILRGVDLDVLRADIDMNLYGPTVRVLALPKNTGAIHAQQINQGESHSVENRRPDESRPGAIVPPIRER